MLSFRLDYLIAFSAILSGIALFYMVNKKSIAADMSKLQFFSIGLATALGANILTLFLVFILLLLNFSGTCTKILLGSYKCSIQDYLLYNMHWATLLTLPLFIIFFLLFLFSRYSKKRTADKQQ